MKNFTNPLENIKIASPCSANWNEMYGNERKRYCSECKLNVYNLSDMTQTEAENFLINSEGRVCIKFYRRTDGTVLMQDCPVGWQGVKKRVSRMATAVFAMITGFFGGNFVFNQTSFDNSDLTGKVTVVPKIIKETKQETNYEMVDGRISNLDEVKTQIKKTTPKKNYKMVLGRVENDEPVKLQIK